MASWLAGRPISGVGQSTDSLWHVAVIKTFIGGDWGCPAGAKYSAGNI